MLKAIFNFEAIDSTRDLCDLFAYLFKKGIYHGGNLIADAVNKSVYISPFRLISHDGTHVISDTTITLELKSKGSYYVVCKAKYNTDKDNVLEVSLKTSQQIETDSLKNYYVMFGLIQYDGQNEANVIYNDIRDVITPIGEKYKGED